MNGCNIFQKGKNNNYANENWNPCLHCKWYFVTKIVLNYCEKKCSIDREKLLKFEAEGREFANFLRTLEQFIQAVKGPNNFLVTEYFFYLFLDVSDI